jgi:hypothetical protein
LVSVPATGLPAQASQDRPGRGGFPLLPGAVLGANTNKPTNRRRTPVCLSRSPPPTTKKTPMSGEWGVFLEIFHDFSEKYFMSGFELPMQRNIQNSFFLTKKHGVFLVFW